MTRVWQPGSPLLLVFANSGEEVRFDCDRGEAWLGGGGEVELFYGAALADRPLEAGQQRVLRGVRGEGGNLCLDVRTDVDDGGHRRERHRLRIFRDGRER